MREQYRQLIAIASIATVTRLLFLLFIVFVARHGSQYDSSAELPVLDCSGRTSESPSQPPATIFSGLQRLNVWDSQFFIRISQCGYEYEQIHAFFPLLPAALHTLSRIGYSAVENPLNVSLLISVGLLLSWICSIVSAVALFTLSKKVLRNDGQAFLASIFFCFNPASVFHSAVYTEALFAMLSLLALNFLSTHPFLSATLLGASTSVRSNGIVSACYVINNGIKRHVTVASSSVGSALLNGFWTLLEILLVAAPLVAFQLFGFRQFCQASQHSAPFDGREGVTPPWCAARLPYLYGYVQQHYWGVGFLRYFEAKQLPNFLLAAAILVMTSHSCYRFVSDHGVRRALQSVFLPGGTSFSISAPRRQSASSIACDCDQQCRCACSGKSHSLGRFKADSRPCTPGCNSGAAVIYTFFRGVYGLISGCDDHLHK